MTAFAARTLSLSRIGGTNSVRVQLAWRVGLTVGFTIGFAAGVLFAVALQPPV